MDERSHFINRNCIDDFDECEFVIKSYRMSTSGAEREIESSFNKVQSDDTPLQRQQLNMPKRDCGKYLKASSKIMYRSKGGQAVLRCRKSVDLINGEGKKRRRAPVAFSQSNKSVIKFDAPKYESNLQIKKWVQSLQDQGQKESSDIEEGQIVTEKWESSTEEASVSGRDASKVQRVGDSVKKRMSQNE
ncbi:unnamed protein product, partial [Sphenostylis stenocarpa]